MNNSILYNSKNKIRLKTININCAIKHFLFKAAKARPFISERIYKACRYSQSYLINIFSFALAMILYILFSKLH